MKKKVPTFWATIYICGNAHTINAACRRFVVRGGCVSITPMDFVFTGGAESGAAVGLINNGRFNPGAETVLGDALELAQILLNECCQRSCSVVTADHTYYLEQEDMEAR